MVQSSSPEHLPPDTCHITTCDLKTFPCQPPLQETCKKLGAGCLSNMNGDQYTMSIHPALYFHPASISSSRVPPTPLHLAAHAPPRPTHHRAMARHVHRLCGARRTRLCGAHRHHRLKAREGGGSMAPKDVLLIILESIQATEP